MESERHKAFIKLFDYEVQNRAFALAGLQTLARTEEDPVKKQFWQAYVSLEHMNQEKYRPFAVKFDIAQEPTFMTSVRASLLVSAYKWFPSYTWGALHKATAKHVGKLEKMATLANEDDKDFFSYVVSQEKAQLDAIMLMMNGKDQQAIALLADFVARRQ